MTALHDTMRAIAAAVSIMLAAASVPASAQDRAPSATVSSDGRVIILDALPAAWRSAIEGGLASATVLASGSDTGIPATVEMTEGTFVVQPWFPVLRGVPHVLRIAMGTERLELPVASDAPVPEPARVTEMWPDIDVLPENTLRLYVTFSAPMARGVTDHIHLETPEGVRLDDSFLNLAVELWSQDQTRLTLLLDPGRIKQGVGPNVTIGAPLEADRGYRLVVDPEARDALGRRLVDGFAHEFTTGPALRDAIDPLDWAIDLPDPGTADLLSVAFDRPVDRAIALRAISAVNSDGVALRGTVAVTDMAWTFTPDTPWSTIPDIRIDPVMEDVAGNTICQPFDVVAGQAIACSEPVVIDLGAVSSPQ
ncbi:MAG: hypothetical protein AAF264_04220 [Pseudomonadota bacterium]